ncbi:MAG: glycosyltransferase family 39 protein [Anaerolineae bacterium]|nr:glycosyltransferase family 39 protein [Anaerolineae bacterium]
MRGIFWGAIYLLPPQYPPMVILTSLVGGLLGGSLVAMRAIHLVWFALMLAAVYGIGKELGDGWLGVTSVLIVGTMPLVFFWAQMIMGESSLFAILAILLLLLLRWGDKLTPRRGVIIGFVIGLGTLTKQHFPLLAVGPLGLWALWLGKRYWQDKEQRRNLLYSLLLVAASAIFIASLWYGRNLQAMMSYASQPEDLHPHTLGPMVSWHTVSTYFRGVLEHLSWPSALLVILGISWACYRLLRADSRHTPNDWKAIAPALLLVSGAIGVIGVVVEKNVNTRYFSPVLVPWGILSGLALRSVQKQSRFVGPTIVLIILVLQVVSWWNLSFGPVLPDTLGVSPQDSFMRPVDIDPLPQAIRVLETHLEPSDEAKIWLVGGTDRFNPPMVTAMIMEHGYSWQAQELYQYDESDLEAVLDRLRQGEWIVVHETTQPAGSRILTKFDANVRQHLQANPNFFDLVSHLESARAQNQIWIYKVRRDK